MTLDDYENQSENANKAPFLSLVLALIFLLLVTGCTSTTRQAKFYLLQPMSRSEAHGLAVVATPSLVGIGPVDTPAYLDRPQIVTGDLGAELKLAEYHRWAEPLRDTITRVLAENLSLLLPSSQIIGFPWNRTVNLDFQLEIKINRFHVDATGQCELNATWSLLKANKLVVMKQFLVKTSANSNDYAAKVSAQSYALEAFAKSLAEGLQNTGQVIN